MHSRTLFSVFWAMGHLAWLAHDHQNNSETFEQPSTPNWNLHVLHDHVKKCVSVMHVY